MCLCYYNLKFCYFVLSCSCLSFVSFIYFGFVCFVCSFQGFGSGDSPSEYDIDNVSSAEIMNCVSAAASELTEHGA